MSPPNAYTNIPIAYKRNLAGDRRRSSTPRVPHRGARRARATGAKYYGKPTAYLDRRITGRFAPRSSEFSPSATGKERLQKIKATTGPKRIGSRSRSV